MLRLSAFGYRSGNVCFKGASLVRSFTDRGFTRAAVLPTSSHHHVFARRSNSKTQICQLSQKHDFTEKNWSLVYEGPLSKTVKYVKRFSVTTAAASLVGSPILVYFGKQSIPLVGKLALASLLCVIGTFTTVILHWFTKGYVHKLYYNSTQQVFSAETLSFLGGKQRTDFVLSDIVFPEVESAFSTFEANGKPLFIHQEMVEAQQVLHFLQNQKLDKR